MIHFIYFQLANKVINPCQISHELSKDFGEIVMHDQEKFLEAFGICMKYNLKKLSESDESLAIDQLTEVVMDLGRKPSARYFVVVVLLSCLLRTDISVHHDLQNWHIKYFPPFYHKKGISVYWNIDQMKYLRDHT